jgi:hypothetical protein
MAVSRMSPGYPNPIRPLFECSQDKLGTHSAGTGNPYHPDIRRILQTADTCKVSSPIAAPVAKKSYNFRFPLGIDD